MISQTMTVLAATAMMGVPASGPRPQDDLFGHVNAQWLTETEIPPHAPWISPFVENTLTIQGAIVPMLARHQFR